MKLMSYKFVVFFILNFFAKNLNAQVPPCEWKTQDQLSKFATCINEFREVYDNLLEENIKKSNRYEMTINEMYDYLYTNYDKLTNYYMKGVNKDPELANEYKLKKKSLLKLNN